MSHQLMMKYLQRCNQHVIRAKPRELMVIPSIRLLSHVSNHGGSCKCCVHTQLSTSSRWPPCNRFSTFVSSHYRMVEPSNVPHYLERRGFSYKDTPTHYVVRYCPLCEKPHHDKADNLYKLYIRKADGSYFCHRCGSGGSWYDFKAKLGDSPAIDSPTASSSKGGRTATRSPDLLQSAAMQLDGQVLQSFGGGAAETAEIPENNVLSGAKRVALSDVVTARDDLLTHGKHPKAYKYLTETRGILPSVLQHYSVGAVTRRMNSLPGNVSSLISGGAAKSSATEIHECIVFPWLSWKPGSQHTEFNEETITCSRVKLRSITDKSKQILLPRGGGWGMFGWHTIPASATTLVITEGEFDALSVYQATGLPTVSLPNGCRSFPVELVPLLERFEKIYLWMDDDLAGREGAEKISAKLGMGRCHLVSTRIAGATSIAASVSGKDGLTRPPKDANEVLLMKGDLKAMVAAATRRPHDQIISFKDIRMEALREVAASFSGYLSPERANQLGVVAASAAGTPIRCLPRFQHIIKGHRRGEMSIVTGPTGSGKTTLLSQLSLDLAAQGVRTLWGSFEIKVSRLIATMLHQLRSDRIELSPELAAQLSVDNDDIVEVAPPGFDITRAMDVISASASNGVVDEFTGFERAADVLAQLPVQFLRFYGSTDVEKVLDALEYAAYVHDCEHVILDNLQFMMSASTVGRGIDKFDMQEKAIEKFRSFATKHDVHVTLVIHPRKEAEDAPLGLQSIFGSAKATQEADSVIILQRDPEGRKFLDVRKNRYDGTLGNVALSYDKTFKIFTENDRFAAEAAGLAGKSVTTSSTNTAGVKRGSSSKITVSKASATTTQTRSFSTNTRTDSGSGKQYAWNYQYSRSKQYLRKQLTDTASHRVIMQRISEEIDASLRNYWIPQHNAHVAEVTPHPSPASDAATPTQ